MFDAAQQFYPTPEPLVRAIWAKATTLLGHCPTEVFDPEGGSGNLLERPKGFGYNHNTKGYAVEIDANLQAVLRDHGYKVLGSDFLGFDDPIDFECVLTNPPFNNGVEHVFKSWTFVRPKGVIVGVLNAETLKNPHTKERRRLLDLIEEHGGWESVGQPFKDAERTTDVEVVMFWMLRPAKVLDPSAFKFSGNFQTAAPETFKEFGENPLASSDAITSLVAQYRLCLNLLRTRSEVQSELNFHLRSVPGQSRSDDKVAMTFDQFSEVQDLKYRMWHSVFKMTRMGEISTSDFRKKFSQFVHEQEQMEFNKSNILEALAMFFQNKEQIWIDSICSWFDRATAFHENNKVHPEGWKTNCGHELNKRIIIPSGITVGWSGSSWNVAWGRPAETFYSDLDEIISHLSGVPYDESQGFYRSIDNKSLTELPPGTWHNLQHYRVRLYKKGTVHLEIRDPYLRDEVNYIVGKERSWLGGAGF